MEELRASQADIEARRHFTEPKQPIKDTRTVLREMTQPRPELPFEDRMAVSASKLRKAADDGFVEVG